LNCLNGVLKDIIALKMTINAIEYLYFLTLKFICGIPMP